MMNQDEITFLEFKAWLTGLIVGKNGKLPDLEDWKQIKAMMDKVVAKETIKYVPQPYKVSEPSDPFRPGEPSPSPFRPYRNPFEPHPWRWDDQITQPWYIGTRWGTGTNLDSENIHVTATTSTASSNVSAQLFNGKMLNEDVLSDGFDEMSVHDQFEMAMEQLLAHANETKETYKDGKKDD